MKRLFQMHTTFQSKPAMLTHAHNPIFSPPSFKDFLNTMHPNGVGQCLIKTQVDHIFSSNHPKKGEKSRAQTLFDQILHDLKPQEMLKASKERLTRTL